MIKLNDLLEIVPYYNALKLPGKIEAARDLVHLQCRTHGLINVGAFQLNRQPKPRQGRLPDRAHGVNRGKADVSRLRLTSA